MYSMLYRVLAPIMLLALLACAELNAGTLYVGTVDGGITLGTTYTLGSMTATDNVDTSFMRTVKGFAYRQNSPGVHVQTNVDLYVNGLKVATRLANEPRLDVRQNNGVAIDTGFTFSVPAFPPGTTSYVLDVKFTDNNVSLTGPLDPAYTTPRTTPAPFRYFANRTLPITVSFKGLLGNYFDVYTGAAVPTNLNTLRVRQVDPTVDFANYQGYITNTPAGNDQPHIYVNMNNYGMSWTGDYVPTATGPLQLGARWDDQVLITLDGTQLFASACCGGPSFQGTMNVVAGRRYELKVHFGEGAGGSYMQFYHRMTGFIPTEIVPNSVLFANQCPKVNRGLLQPGTLTLLTLTTPEDTPLNLGLGTFDGDGDPITGTILTAPANGAISGTFPNWVYTPNPNYYGADSFTFRMTDPFDNSDVYTVPLTVTAVNDALTPTDDIVSTPEDIAAAFIVLANDNAVDIPITVNIDTPPANGAVVVNADGSITYTPAPNFNGVDTFIYRVTDAVGPDTGLATVTVTVTPVNDPPVAGPDALTANQNLALPIATLILLANDSDPVEGDAITIVAVSPASSAGGTVSLANGIVTYTPPLNFTGTDTFTYTLADSGGATAVGTVTLNVLPAPVFTSQPVISPNPTVVGQQVFFSATATYTTGPGPFVWNFGDGTSANGANVTHTYTTAGLYNVTVTAFDADGGQTTFTTQLLVSFSLDGATGSTSLTPPGEGILVGGSGAGSSFGGKGKILVDYLNRERTSFSGALGKLKFPGITQAALQGKTGILTLGSGPGAQTFIFSLNAKGRGVTTSLKKMDINLAKGTIKFQAGGRPELTDIVEALGAAYQPVKKPAPRTIKLPARITFQDFGGFALAITYQMTLKQARTTAKGATGK